MAKIETSYLEGFDLATMCDLHHDYSITLTLLDSGGEPTLTIDAKTVMNLLDFLSDWKRDIRNAVGKEEERRADKEADKEADRALDRETLLQEENTLRKAMGFDPIDLV